MESNSKMARIKIHGMTCASCVATIEKAVGNLDGVSGVQVNLSSEQASLVYDPAKVSMDEIEKTVDQLGYKVVHEKVSVKVGGMHCASCVATLEKALGNVNGVASVSVNLNTEQASIAYNPAVAGIEALRDAITGAGYQFLGRAGETNDDAGRAALARDLQAKLRRAITGIGVGLVLMVLMYVIPHGLVQAWTMLLLATPAFFYASLPILRAAWSAVKNRSINMDVMYATGIGVAYVSSTIDTLVSTFLQIHPMIDFYESSVMLAGFLMLGRYLEAKAKGKTSEAIKKLVGLQPKVATVIRDGKEIVIDAMDIQKGDTVVVKPGERVPADGTVIEGKGYVDESMITGEPLPVQKRAGSSIVGGTINKNSVLTFSTTRVGKDTVLSQIIKLVEEAQGTKPAIQKLADKAVEWFHPVLITIAALTFITWLLVLGELLTPLTRLITVLVIACPCALGLATPTAVTAGIGRGAELGILIKNGEVLEKANKISTVIFDKTGTLTVGKPEVTDVRVTGGMDETGFLGLVAAVERNSQHPLAEAIVKKARLAGSVLGPATGFDTIEGKGVLATVDGHEVLVGNKGLLLDRGVDARSLEADAASLEAQAKTVVHVAIDGKPAGIIAIADTLRPGAARAVEALHAMGIDTMMITGDNASTAKAIASMVGIKEVIAEVLPQDKAEKVQALQAAGKVVAFTGDGINDAPALARADLGIAMGGGTDVAIESGELVVMKDDPIDAVAAIQLSRKVLAKIKMNLFWAFAYNAALVPVAIFGLFLPEYAGLAMAMSSVTVVSLSLLLRRYTPPVKRGVVPTRVIDDIEGEGVSSPAGIRTNTPSIGTSGREEDQTPKLRCQSCDMEMDVPWHCNQPMHVEQVDGKDMLVCWMGPECGKESLPVHCKKPMAIGRKEEQHEPEVHESMNPMTVPEGTRKTATLECKTCGTKTPAPTHCGWAMHVEKVDGKDMLVCWMGTGCGKQELPTHCGSPMTLV